MYFLLINKIRMDANPAALSKVISEHVRWTKEQISASKIAQAGKWGDSGGMVIIRAQDLSEAQNILNEDPLVKSGLITFEIARSYPDVEIR